MTRRRKKCWRTRDGGFVEVRRRIRWIDLWSMAGPLLTPRQARELAKWLNDVADAIDTERKQR